MTAASVTLARWQQAFGVSTVAAAHVLASARHAPGDWRTVLDALGLVEQVIKQAVKDLLDHNEGGVVALSPLAHDVLQLLPERRWSRKEIAMLAMLWLGLSWRRDLAYDRVTALSHRTARAA